MARSVEREVTESIPKFRGAHTYTELEWLILRGIDGKPLSLRSISDFTSEPHDRCARALRSLIRQEKVIPVRERREIVYELIPGSLINWILEHEV